MAIVSVPQMYAILGQSNLDVLDVAISTTYPNDHLKLSTPGQWLVWAPGTARELCDQLGISDGKSGTAVVVSFTSYYGRASNPIWEWVASRLGSKRG